MLNALDLPASLSPTIPDAVLRTARPDDVDAIIRLLTDDDLTVARGHGADTVDRAAYLRGLESVIGDPANTIVVADHPVDGVVGTMQLTVIPGMTRGGATRLHIEAVRVRSDLRSAGIGGAMMRWVTEVAAPRLGVALVQLTSDDRRVDAHRFYERLGFAGSHRGFKYAVPRG
ncbi:GNAT family N-acetyltransferase [Agromyces larvae]|uniref:GNAT family N-acetyltransferase n=1 Tax=Agromyces larvae TaxID=2929802 RepID=A0ABY4BZV8_9MICO|nr:GNAT family N-acetyltransferase [Agromyces larvae]UOE43226.1 GNAT family N-acetyltransferase [Agromyces larvae]